jgi:hypothetical protein
MQQYHLAQVGESSATQFATVEQATLAGLTLGCRFYPILVVKCQLMTERISHDRNDESLEAKAQWFQSLSLAERMELLCEFTELVLENNPQVTEVGRAQSSAGRVCVLSVA